MKKLKYLLLGLSLFILTGCSLSKDTLENSTIYTTTYPVKYLAKYLYGDYATIESIYPNSINIDEYTLTDKQIKDFSKGNLFIYNGLSDEKTIAKNLINNNRKMLIIDVSYGLSISNGMKELWLSPNDYLMLAKNIKNGLIENLKSKIIIESINKKYDEIEINLSLKDAELRSIAKDSAAKKKNKIVVSDNDLLFLNSYGFDVISLDENTLSEAGYNLIDNDFKNKVYKSIIVLDNNENDYIKKIKNKYKITTLDVSSMTNIDVNDQEDYLMNMQLFIDNLKNLVLN